MSQSSDRTLSRLLVLVLGLWLAAPTPSDAAEPFRFVGGSELPLAILDTAGKPILNDPKIDATLSLIDRGAGHLNSLADSPTTVAKIRIEIRGSSSQMFDKKSYRFETVDGAGRDKNVKLLDLPRESDWILYGPYSEKSLIRNHLAYALSNRIGRYAPRTRHVELFLRDSDAPLAEQYVGVYLLLEPIQRGAERVDVPRIRRDESGQFTGGYVLKIDRVGGPETYFTSELGTVVGFVSPRGDRLDEEQRAWIRRDFSRLERSLATAPRLVGEDGFGQQIEAGSFIDFFLINELFKNVDAYFLSTFLHKAGDGKLHMGPIWDLDLSSGNASYGGAWHTRGWMLFPDDPMRQGAAPFWWDRLFEDADFRQQLVARWRQIRGESFSNDSILGMIDQTARRLDEPQRRNFERWPVWGTYIWPNPRPYAKSYADEIGRLKTWLTARLAWMDENIDKLGPPSAKR